MWWDKLTNPSVEVAREDGARAPYAGFLAWRLLLSGSPPIRSLIQHNIVWGDQWMRAECTCAWRTGRSMYLCKTNLYNTSEISEMIAECWVNGGACTAYIGTQGHQNCGFHAYATMSPEGFVVVPVVLGGRVVPHALGYRATHARLLLDPFTTVKYARMIQATNHRDMNLLERQVRHAAMQYIRQAAHAQNVYVPTQGVQQTIQAFTTGQQEDSGS